MKNATKCDFHVQIKKEKREKWHDECCRSIVYFQLILIKWNNKLFPRRIELNKEIDKVSCGF